MRWMTWRATSASRPYLADKADLFPSRTAIRDSFRVNDVPAMVIATQWSTSHPYPVGRSRSEILNLKP
jgi:hypothetical protein